MVCEECYTAGKGVKDKGNLRRLSNPYSKLTATTAAPTSASQLRSNPQHQPAVNPAVGPAVGPGSSACGVPTAAAVAPVGSRTADDEAAIALAQGQLRAAVREISAAVPQLAAEAEAFLDLASRAFEAASVRTPSG